MHNTFFISLKEYSFVSLLNDNKGGLQLQKLFRYEEIFLVFLLLVGNSSFKSESISLAVKFVVSFKPRQYSI